MTEATFNPALFAALAPFIAERDPRFYLPSNPIAIETRGRFATAMVHFHRNLPFFGLLIPLVSTVKMCLSPPEWIAEEEPKEPLAEKALA